ncbi:hypothetical protein LIER_32348 [Lithospermum erythrorhizon]|uniref:C2H2-type domain-containing protein n=1 Tax=Lithospermum erythrorhizon TaxID=34254 RepID=A0AAV3RX17_LITER
MAKAFMKHKFFHMEKLESQDGVNKRSLLMCPYCLKNFKHEKSFENHKRIHLMKINHILLRCDLLKDLPYSWSKTKKRTNHVKGSKFEHPCEENRIKKNHNLFLVEGRNRMTLTNDQPNGLVNSLPIKKRRIKDVHDDVKDKKEKCLEKIEVIKSEEKYICNICSRSFNSYQALRGHKGHHGRAIKLESIEFGERSYDKIHQCCYCNKIFSKGQALGGHKRYCKKGKTISYPPVDDIKLFNLDLNELPHNEDMCKQDLMIKQENEDGAHDIYLHT